MKKIMRDFNVLPNEGRVSYAFAVTKFGRMRPFGRELACGSTAVGLVPGVFEKPAPVETLRKLDGAARIRE